MKPVETKLRIVFVGPSRRICREVITKCLLKRDGGIPTIKVLDNMIVNLLDNIDGVDIPFYDVKNNRFCFTTSNLFDLSHNAENDPEEIIMEVLEAGDHYQLVEYYYMEPGLWDDDDEGCRYRVCDNSILHIIMDTKIKPMVDANEIGFEDGAAMTLFFYLNNNLSFHYFDHNVDDDEDEMNDDEVDFDEYCENHDCSECEFCCKENCDDYDSCDVRKNIIKVTTSGTNIKNDPCTGNCDECCNERCELWETCECGKAHKEALENDQEKLFNAKKLYPNQVKFDVDSKDTVGSLKCLKINIKNKNKSHKTSK